VLAAVLISAGNAIVRKAFNIGSNAFLEIQWYLFAAVFMLGVGYVMLKNAHVRIDFISSSCPSAPTPSSTPSASWSSPSRCRLIMIDLGWPVFMRAWVSGEMSQNAGGLIRWPVLLLMPLGFGHPAAAGGVRTDQAHRLPDGPPGRALHVKHESRRSAQELRRSRSRQASKPSWPPKATDMTEFITQNFVPLMFAGLFVFLLTGIPVAFGLAATGLLFGFIGMEVGLFPTNLFQALPLRVFGIMQNDTLLAIPFFTFMGIILERSGMAEDLLERWARCSARCAAAWPLR
jgi:TRAP-type C4-dicarboxylate transport system permease small subunit